MFIPRKFWGLGVINPTTNYIAKKISFLLSTLNSDDPQTRHSARSSLELHMKRRRVDKNNIDSSFAGYCTDENGRLVKQCAVNCPKSVWIELNELCMREGLRLEMSGDEYVGQIQNLRFCDGRNLADIFSCPEFPVVRLDTMNGFSE